MSFSFIKCPICGDDKTSPGKSEKYMFYTCPTCGRYELDPSKNLEDFNMNHLSSFIFYNRFKNRNNSSEYRYHTVRAKDECDVFSEHFSQGDNIIGHPVHMDNDIVEAWYPKSFSERVDYIISYLGTHNEHIGQTMCFSYKEAFSLLFVDRKEQNPNISYHKILDRSESAMCKEANYMLDSLEKRNLLKYETIQGVENTLNIQLTPEGYSRVDELQKNTSYGKAVLVAMKFGDDTKGLREAIRSGITKAGYHAVFIDEVEHIDFITPELLKHIRDSKFVVVDLTHQNNGAYFEEGYAMGVGKPVIQLCKKDTKLHFDIAQKNTIMWGSEEDIPDRLCNRIKATIE